MEGAMLFHVIDDDKMNLEVVIEMIEGIGHQALGFECAETYVGFLSSEKFSAPAAVMTDIRMPGMNGLELVRQIRSRLPFQKIAVISGTAQDSLAIESELCSAISKPFRHETLDSFIQAMVDCEKSCEEALKCYAHDMCEFGLNHPCPFAPKA